MRLPSRIRRRRGRRHDVQRHVGERPDVRDQLPRRPPQAGEDDQRERDGRGHEADHVEDTLGAVGERRGRACLARSGAIQRRDRGVRVVVALDRRRAPCRTAARTPSTASADQQQPEGLGQRCPHHHLRYDERRVPGTCEGEVDRRGRRVDAEQRSRHGQHGRGLEVGAALLAHVAAGTDADALVGRHRREVAAVLDGDPPRDRDGGDLDGATRRDRAQRSGLRERVAAPGRRDVQRARSRRPADRP